MLLGEDSEGRAAIHYGYKLLPNGNVSLTLDYSSEFGRLNRVISDFWLIAENLEATPPYDVQLFVVSRDPLHEQIEKKEDYLCLRTSIEAKVSDLQRFIQETPLKRVE